MSTLSPLGLSGFKMEELVGITFYKIVTTVVVRIGKMVTASLKYENICIVVYLSSISLFTLEDVFCILHSKALRVNPVLASPYMV